MVPGLSHTSFYDSLGLFEHILTDSENFRFLHTPYHIFFYPAWVDVNLLKYLGNLEISPKIPPNFGDFSETF